MIAEQVRAAGEADLEHVTETLWLAFQDDPLWGWAFPEHAMLEPWWRFLVTAALRHRWVWLLGDYAAVSVWIPPGRDELTHAQERQVEGLLWGLLGSRAAQVIELLACFDAAHPRDQPHYYLSLLGTRPDRRGHGLGMALLAENLARIDRRQMPAYLESSNPENVARYEAKGFAPIGEFSTPDGSHSVCSMWREPRDSSVRRPSAADGGS